MSLRVIARFAARDLRGGLRGLRVFLACVTMGVAAITGVGAVSQSLLWSLANQGRVMLGGDIAFGRSQRALSDPERAVLASFGPVSEIATLRSTARTADDATMVEIKAVDDAYPLVGAAVVTPPISLAEALRDSDGAFGAVADATLIERLSLHVGDKFMLGDKKYALRGELAGEPDRIATGVGFAPRVMISTQGLAASGLQTAASLMRWTARVALPAGAGDGQIQHAIETARARFPESGWEARTRANFSPQLTRSIERFSQFMALIGVISLIVGGVGVAGAVASFVDRKRESIAIFKALGASGSTVFLIVLTEMMTIACAGAALGAAIGASAPFLVAALIGRVVELPFEPIVSGSALGSGSAIGLLAALAFIVAPAGRAHDLPVADLFRLAAIAQRAALRRRYAMISAACFAALIGLVYTFTSEKRVTIMAIAGVLGSALILRAVAWVIARLAVRASRIRNLPARLAFGNIHRPGAVTAPVVTSLGLGLTLLVVIISVDGNLRRQLREGQPDRTPDFFFIDVQSSQAADFRRLLAERRPDDSIEEVPMLRGRIVRVGLRRAEDVRADDNVAWALEGDRGITYASAPTEGSRVVEGQWWRSDYNGPPLVSVDAEIATGLQLKIGDEIAVNVAGRTIVATIANLRRVEWRSFGINFVLVFSPATFIGAPHTELFAVTSRRGVAIHDRQLVRDIARSFPNVTTISVREFLGQALALVEKLSSAIRAASAVTVIMALLVLGGALAAGQRARLYDATVLRTLGATRRLLVGAYLLEFATLGAATSVFAIGAGSLVAWLVVTRLMKLDFSWAWSGTLATVGIGCATTILLGLAATWRILGEKPAGVLREL